MRLKESDGLNAKRDKIPKMNEEKESCSKLDKQNFSKEQEEGPPVAQTHELRIQ